MRKRFSRTTISPTADRHFRIVAASAVKTVYGMISNNCTRAYDNGIVVINYSL